jgi:hypothetical protein
MRAVVEFMAFLVILGGAGMVPYRFDRCYTHSDLVDPRIYRASFVLALLALVVVMFSLEARPRPHTADLAPDAFSGTDAYRETGRLAARYPDRRAGSPGDAALGDFVARRFRALGMETSRQTFFTDVDGNGDAELSNVIGRLRGRSDRQVVILSHRDSAGRPGASAASGTAVLLELAQALDALDRRRTMVFVSTDGATEGLAGARRFAERYADRQKVEAALVLDDVGAAGPQRPYVIPWSTGSSRASLEVVRSVDAALAQETGAGGGSESWLGQLVHLAWPLTLREQGPLVREGIDAVTLTARAELPRGAGPDTLAGISENRLTRFGRAAFASVLAFDSPGYQGKPPSRYLTAGRNVIPGWSLALFALGLILPAVITGVDAVARASRRGAPVGPWLRWSLATALPFAVTAVGALCFELVGWLPDSIEEAVSPATRQSLGEALGPLIALAILFALSWVVLRRIALGEVRPRRLSREGAAASLALLLAVEVLVVCAVNPFTALLLVPATHLCLLAALSDTPRRTLLVATMMAGALTLPVLAMLYYGARFDLGLSLHSYVLMVVSTFAGSISSAILGSLIAGSLTSTALLAMGGGRRTAPAITVRGPVTYAGPGSLGGTESALRQ